MKILGTTKISYEIEKIFEKSDELLVVVSPYLKINNRLKVVFADSLKRTKSSYLICRENQLNSEHRSWLSKFKNIKVLPIPNLHSKIYLNQDMAIITSMNLYEYSQINNHEIGIKIEYDVDQAEFNDTLKEIQHIVQTHYDDYFEDLMVEEDYTFGKLFKDLNSRYTFRNYRPNSKDLFEFISEKAQQITKIEEYELYSDKSAILRAADLGRRRYKLIKEKIVLYANE